MNSLTMKDPQRKLSRDQIITSIEKFIKKNFELRKRK